MTLGRLDVAGIKTRQIKLDVCDCVRRMGEPANCRVVFILKKATTGCKKLTVLGKQG